MKSFKKINEGALKIQSKISLDLQQANKSCSSTRGLKESFFNNEEINSSSNSSYAFTQKKRHESPLLPPGSGSDCRIFNRINEERNMYRRVYTSKSITSDFLGYEPHNSSDFMIMDFNKFQKVSDRIESSSFTNDKSTFSSFEIVKMWSVYFPQNNVLNIVQGFGKSKKKKTIINLAQKEEILNKSMISSKKNSNIREGLFQKMKKKKSLRKSKTEIDTNIRNRRRSFFDTIKTFFKT